MDHHSCPGPVRDLERPIFTQEDRGASPGGFDQKDEAGGHESDPRAERGLEDTGYSGDFLLPPEKSP